MKPARILVVDDQPGMLRAVERILGRRHQVLCFTSSRQALEGARDFDPELAILDIRMPDLDGFELTSLLKKRHPGIDVILMTGSASDPDQNLIRALREDAFYFIQKPFDSEVLVALVARCLQLRALEDENRRHTRRLEAELAEARGFQLGLLPPAEASIGRFAIDCIYEPSSELGGDFYDYAPTTSRAGVAVMIADVSGHGASAAMLTGIVKSGFQSSATDGYDPLAVVLRIFGSIGSFAPEKFVTVLCARLSDDEGVLDYVNAGHPYGFVWRPGPGQAAGNGGAAGSREWIELAPTGPLISPALPAGKARWEKHEIRIAPGDRLFLTTDGILEASGETDFFGDQRLRAAIDASPEGGAPLLEAILAAVRDHAKGRPPSDDFTMMSVRFA
jgi:sigma-B regulation protein RsbU (phosphoserine phosphatase)